MKRQKKKNVSVSEMEDDRLYIDSDGTLYRRLSRKLECMKPGKWVEVPITLEVLHELKLRER